MNTGELFELITETEKAIKNADRLRAKLAKEMRELVKPYRFERSGSFCWVWDDIQGKCSIKYKALRSLINAYEQDDIQWRKL